jgi:hypothetical protein
VGLIFPTVVSDKPTSVKATFTNVGKSIANPSWELGVMEIVKSANEPTMSLKNPYGFDKQSTSQLYPNDPGTFLMMLHDNSGKALSLNVSEVENLNSGESYIAVFGYVIYWDQFGKHWTRFCSWKAYSESHTINAGNCTGWNTNGDGDPPDDIAAQYTP